jgi:hypothetical protein
MFHEKHRNFPKKIVPTKSFSAGKICTISAGKAGIFEVTESFCESAGYWNATLQFSRFPTATFGTENETTRTATRLVQKSKWAPATLTEVATFLAPVQ